MIEKLPFTQIHTGGEDMVDRVEFQPVAPYEMQHKINELVDTVNKQEQTIKILIDGLERFAKSQQEVNMEITAMITKGSDNEK